MHTTTLTAELQKGCSAVNLNTYDVNSDSQGRYEGKLNQLSGNSLAKLLDDQTKNVSKK